MPSGDDGFAFCVRSRDTAASKSVSRAAHVPGPLRVKSGKFRPVALSRIPDLAISAHLMTDAEIDDFMNDAITELEEIRLDAKKALAATASP